MAPNAESQAPVPAKKSGRDAGGTTKPDRVFLPNAKDAIPIRTNSAEMFVLQQLRDEAHRFAISFHRNSRRRLTLRSALSDIPGIGPGRQRQLLRHFGSVKRVREATVDELAAVAGMTRTSAEAVFAHWAKQPLESQRRSDRRPRDLRGAGDRRRLHQHRRRRRRDDVRRKRTADVSGPCRALADIS